ncbi:MAG: cell division protein FtsZ [Kiritimatiellia bacterium]
MNENLTKAAPQAAVIGVGHGGEAIVSRLGADRPDGPACFLIGTDREMMKRSPLPEANKVLIGESLTKGLSTGGNVELGRKVADEDGDRWQGVFAGIPMAFLVGGLGGGLATGALPVLARKAHAFGVMTVCIVTLPYDFEGDNRRMRAEEGLSALQEAADVVIVISNQKLFRLFGDMKMTEAFVRADVAASRALYSVWRMISGQGLIKLDYADVRSLLSAGGGLVAFGYGDGSGADKARKAADELVSNPLLDNGLLLHECEALLVSVSGGTDLTVKEMELISNVISGTLRKGVRMVMGTFVDEACADRVTITALVSETRRKDASGQIQLPLGNGLGKGDPESEREAKSNRKFSVKGESSKQGDLSLDEMKGRGRFKDIEPTIVDGQNVDIPTFMRRDVTI